MSIFVKKDLKYFLFNKLRFDLKIKKLKLKNHIFFQHPNSTSTPE